MSFDPVSTGVGASQVLPYVAELGRRGQRVDLHSWEPGPTPGNDLAGVRWTPHPFGGHGTRGGLSRVAAGARAMRGARLVHARADLAAASALLSRVRPFVWDMRSLWADERLEQGLISPGSATLRVLRRIEAKAANASAAIVVLSANARDVLHERHGRAVADKATVITTCTDLALFSEAAPIEWPDRPDHPDQEVRLLHAGSMNRQYDGELFARFVLAFQRRIGDRISVTVAAQGPTAWENVLEGLGAQVAMHRTTVALDAMPALIAGHQVGMAICRLNSTSLRAAMPTKIGEYLAVGRPVVVSRGTGDLETMIEEHRVGAVIRDASESAIAAAAEQLVELLTDPSTSTRCRALAEAYFSLETGVDRLIDVYERACSTA